MYDSIKVCKYCSWKKRYDSNRDIFGIDSYVFCPVCNNVLIKEGYSPDI